MAVLGARADDAEQQQHAEIVLPTASALRLSAIVFGCPARIVISTIASVAAATAAAANPSAVRVVRSLISSPRISRVTARRRVPSVVSRKNDLLQRGGLRGELVQRHADRERELADLLGASRP